MSQAGIPVLMYHAIEDAQHPAGAKDQGEQLYILSTDKFREQMQYLHTNGFKTYLLNELIKLEVWPQKAVVLTFDDGHESNYTLALPILQEFGFKAEFFITTGWIGAKHFLKPEQIVKLHKAGMGIGSHSATHPYFNDLSKMEIEKEMGDSRFSLEDILGNKIPDFSAPGGRLKKSVMTKIARKINYRTVSTSTPGLLQKSHSLFEIPRFAISNSISIKNFSGIVNLDFLTVFKIQIKNKLLYLAKQIFGNRRYERIRKLVLSQERTRTHYEN